MKNKISVLQIALGTGMLGGVSRFILNYYKEMDREHLSFDFVFCNKNSFGTENSNPILKDSKIYCLECLDLYHNSYKNYFNLIKKLKKIILETKYDIVHINSGSIPLQFCCIFAIRCAKKDQVIIAHSHSSGAQFSPFSIFRYFLFLFAKKYIRINASYCFACSSVAGQALFGKQILKSKKFKIIHNAIDCKKFQFNSKSRQTIREKMNVSSDMFVIGHVGRFDKVKNHVFLIKIFSYFHKIVPNSCLWIIGDGIEKNNIINQIKYNNLEDSVVLTGESRDVANLLQGMDCFVLPSFYEGLSIVAIEAQAAGLNVFLSDKLTREHSVTDLVTYLSIDDSPEEWAKSIISNSSRLFSRDKYDELLIAGYDVKTEAKNLACFYEDIYRGINENLK